MESEAAEPSIDPLAKVLAVLTSPILLTGVYAWIIAIAPSFTLAASELAQGAPVLRPTIAIASSTLAMAALLGGVVLERRGSPAAPALGVWAFALLAVVTWVTLPAAVDVARVDGLRGALGGAGFALFALAWGVPDVFRRAIPEDDPRADVSLPLDARDRLPRAVVPLAAVGIISAAGVSFFAWQVHDVPRGLLAHSLAGIAAVATISVAGQVAIARRSYVPPSPRTRLRRARTAIVLLAVSAVVALTFVVLSR